MRRVALLVFAISMLATGRPDAETRTNPTRGSMWIATEKPDAKDSGFGDRMQKTGIRVADLRMTVHG